MGYYTEKIQNSVNKMIQNKIQLSNINACWDMVVNIQKKQVILGNSAYFWPISKSKI